LNLIGAASATTKNVDYEPTIVEEEYQYLGAKYVLHSVSLSWKVVINPRGKPRINSEEEEAEVDHAAAKLARMKLARDKKRKKATTGMPAILMFPVRTTINLKLY
jgi:hypothetical protein